MSEGLSASRRSVGVAASRRSVGVAVGVQFEGNNKEEVVDVLCVGAVKIGSKCNKSAPATYQSTHPRPRGFVKKLCQSITARDQRAEKRDWKICTRNGGAPPGGASTGAFIGKPSGTQNHPSTTRPAHVRTTTRPRP